MIQHSATQDNAQANLAGITPNTFFSKCMLLLHEDSPRVQPSGSPQISTAISKRLLPEFDAIQTVPPLSQTDHDDLDSNLRKPEYGSPRNDLMLTGLFASTTGEKQKSNPFCTTRTDTAHYGLGGVQDSTNRNNYLNLTLGEKSKPDLSKKAMKLFGSISKLAKEKCPCPELNLKRMNQTKSKSNHHMQISTLVDVMRRIPRKEGSHGMIRTFDHQHLKHTLDSCGGSSTLPKELSKCLLKIKSLKSKASKKQGRNVQTSMGTLEKTIGKKQAKKKGQKEMLGLLNSTHVKKGKKLMSGADCTRTRSKESEKGRSKRTKLLKNSTGPIAPEWLKRSKTYDKTYDFEGCGDHRDHRQAKKSSKISGKCDKRQKFSDSRNLSSTCFSQAFPPSFQSSNRHFQLSSLHKSSKQTIFGLKHQHQQVTKAASKDFDSKHKYKSFLH